jgi:hypothetical protein
MNLTTHLSSAEVKNMWIHYHFTTAPYREPGYLSLYNYGLDGHDLIPGRGTQQRPDRLWGPPSLLFSGYRGRLPGGKAGRA